MPTLKRIRCSIMPDDFADTSYLEQEGFEDRKAAYYREEFCLVGVCSVAEVRLDGEHDAHHACFEVRSPGVWGVEDDCPDHVADIYHEELATLRDMLDELGVAYQEDQFQQAKQEEPSCTIQL